MKRNERNGLGEMATSQKILQRFDQPKSSHTGETRLKLFTKCHLFLMNQTQIQSDAFFFVCFSTTSKIDNSGKRKLYEQQENQENPLRCPVKLYEFYLSKW